MAREFQRQYSSYTAGLLDLGSEVGHRLLVIMPSLPDLPGIEGLLEHGTCSLKKKYVFCLVYYNTYNIICIITCFDQISVPFLTPVVLPHHFSLPISHTLSL